MPHALPRGVAQALLLLACSTLCLGCLTAPHRADRAMQAGQYEQALTLYEESIAEGSRDPQVYYHAALCATKLGSFADAERHFSRSLRYGGGSEVARALAQLYIQTSNYSKAIRILQALLNDERSNPQPIYNNLGTALMYAGEVLDAESYLLIAQQMNPRDPYPYINLGLLYEKYMRQQPLALDFYGCYLQLAAGRAQQERTVKLRMHELQEREGFSPAQQLTCGQPYKPAQQNAQRVQEEMEALKARARQEDAQADSPSSPAQPKDLGLDDAPDASAKPDASRGVLVESGGQLPAPTSPSPDRGELAQRQLARDRFAQRQYAQTIEALEAIPADRLEASDALLLSRSHRALKRPEQAEVWARVALQRQESAVYLQALLELLKERKDDAQLQALCLRYADQELMAPALAMCPKPSR